MHLLPEDVGMHVDVAGRARLYGNAYCGKRVRRVRQLRALPSRRPHQHCPRDNPALYSTDFYDKDLAQKACSQSTIKYDRAVHSP